MQSTKEQQRETRRPFSVIKEIEGNNRMGSTRDLFKKIRDTKVIFHVKMGTIKDRNGMDLTEEEYIKMRWQEYTELQNEVHDIVQEAGIKNIPKKRKCKKAKWLSEEALQITMKRREAKGNGERERYAHLNAEFQRIARRDKKAFLSDQCKEIEEKKQNGKDLRSLQENQRYQGNISCKDGLNKGQKWYGPNRRY